MEEKLYKSSNYQKNIQTLNYKNLRNSIQSVNNNYRYSDNKKSTSNIQSSSFNNLSKSLSYHINNDNNLKGGNFTKSNINLRNSNFIKNNDNNKLKSNNEINNTSSNLRNDNKLKSNNEINNISSNLKNSNFTKNNNEIEINNTSSNLRNTNKLKSNNEIDNISSNLKNDNKLKSNNEIDNTSSNLKNSDKLKSNNEINTILSNLKNDNKLKSNNKLKNNDKFKNDMNLENNNISNSKLQNTNLTKNNNNTTIEVLKSNDKIKNNEILKSNINFENFSDIQFEGYTKNYNDYFSSDKELSMKKSNNINIIEKNLDKDLKNFNNDVFFEFVKDIKFDRKIIEKINNMDEVENKLLKKDLIYNILILNKNQDSECTEKNYNDFENKTLYSIYKKLYIRINLKKSMSKFAILFLLFSKLYETILFNYGCDIYSDFANYQKENLNDHYKFWNEIGLFNDIQNKKCNIDKKIINSKYTESNEEIKRISDENEDENKLGKILNKFVLSSIIFILKKYIKKISIFEELGNEIFNKVKEYIEPPKLIKNNSDSDSDNNNNTDDYELSIIDNLVEIFMKNIEKFDISNISSKQNFYALMELLKKDDNKVELDELNDE